LPVVTPVVFDVNQENRWMLKARQNMGHTCCHCCKISKDWSRHQWPIGVRQVEDFLGISRRASRPATRAVLAWLVCEHSLICQYLSTNWPPHKRTGGIQCWTCRVEGQTKQLGGVLVLKLLYSEYEVNKIEWAVQN
jgi:hypothetical protein